MSDRVTTTTYVTLFYPGAFFPEESVREVGTRDPEAIAREADPAVYAFSFHDKVTTTAIIDGQEIELGSRAINKSGRYYIDAERLTAADVEALPGDHSILLANMRGNHWDTILCCRPGNFQPLEEGDVVISSETVPHD